MPIQATLCNTLNSKFLINPHTSGSLALANTSFLLPDSKLLEAVIINIPQVLVCIYWQNIAILCMVLLLRSYFILSVLDFNIAIGQE